ncbi:hypothetical protein [Acetobacter aceti]|uniref:LysM domain-containing protein n=1 Tax=Acetobacter aceti TaxID=435 RepID=A0A6S6PMT1_ACEAC|nr:hypothetical protein [Acetobacter aceti]BCI68066.1 hypothetical protein AAJCM20276_26900 [Acetobacter aceti]
MTTANVTAVDRSLFHVAAAQLSDATQWWRLAQLNGLSDPSLSEFPTPIPLKIPLADNTLTDGIPSE